MNTKELKEWLSAAEQIEKEIKVLNEARDKAFDIACGVNTYTADERVQSSHSNRAEDKLIAYADYSDMIDSHIKSLFDVQTEIIKVIKLCDDSVYRALLLARYINYKTFEEIAVDTGYCYRQVIRLHGRALQHLLKKMSLNVT